MVLLAMIVPIALIVSRPPMLEARPPLLQARPPLPGHGRPCRGMAARAGPRSPMPGLGRPCRAQ
eukprot:246015-Chlamydomonas_euryale.AAC.1